jgi:hypothetical protein
LFPIDALGFKANFGDRSAPVFGVVTGVVTERARSAFGVPGGVREVACATTTIVVATDRPSASHIVVSLRHEWRAWASPGLAGTSLTPVAMAGSLDSNVESQTAACPHSDKIARVATADPTASA